MLKIKCISCRMKGLQKKCKLPTNRLTSRLTCRLTGLWTK